MLGGWPDGRWPAFQPQGWGFPPQPLGSGPFFDAALRPGESDELESP